MVAPSLLAMIAGAVGPPPCQVDLRLEPGRRWTYEGYAIWSSPGAPADSGPVRWTMSVVDARDTDGARIALVHGLFLELAWYAPGTVPGLSVLVCAGSGLDAVRPPDDEEAGSVFREWPVPARAERMVQLPLEPGLVFGQDPPRTDPMYGWEVSTVPADSVIAVPRSCPRPTAPPRELTYRSLSGHLVVQWLPGVGATRFVYVHHGSPAATDVRLVSCGRGAAIR